MSSYQQLHQQARADAVDEPRRQLEQAMLDRPMFDNAAPHAIVTWVLALFQFLLAFLDGTFGELVTRIDVINEAPPSRGVSIPAATAREGTAPEAPVDAATRPTKQVRCAKCHARGHSTNTCLTQNTAAMRKRVEGNRKRKKDTSKPSQSTSVHPHPYPIIAAYAAPIATPQDTALAADAKELRRRHRQYARDRKKRRAAPPVPGG
ncbi:hypothetical protein EDC04DRAFT_2615139 [Pisolithus marmoratus]|nr:hypothetical protein EDC04DRAFT_2615139 [Pisolithus marmoratus]